MRDINNNDQILGDASYYRLPETYAFLLLSFGLVALEWWRRKQQLTNKTVPSCSRRICTTRQTHDLDKYGCTLADVCLLDGTRINHALVKDGWCWWCRKYAQGIPLTLLVKM
ncbi:hypothetical protein AYO43_04385 [Nitrospira sp. SCGC AG-212-E16]|nr:hypothetical protein AYO43_04385 [Nitrospira sp. SCGC AG-212-E16]